MLLSTRARRLLPPAGGHLVRLKTLNTLSEYQVHINRTASGWASTTCCVLFSHQPHCLPPHFHQVRTNRTASGWAVVKTWCVPVLKVKQRGYAPCTPKKAYTQVKLLLAQQQVCVGG